jgi:hypothetical protein
VRLAPRAHLGSVLADAAGEHERLETVERGRHGSDPGAQPVEVDVEREHGRRLLPLGGRDHRPHVGGAREAEEPRSVLERLGELALGHPGALEQPQDQPGVDTPGPRRHHQALERREAHRGVDAAAVAHGGQRGARAEVAGDDPPGPRAA